MKTEDGVNYYLINNVGIVGDDSTEHAQSALSNKDQTGTIRIREKVTIDDTPVTITKLGKFAFYETKIEKIFLPFTIRELSWACLGRMYSLNEINIPDNNNIKYIDSDFLFASAFSSSFIIPMKIKTISSIAFRQSKVTDLYYCGTRKIDVQIETKHTMHVSPRYSYDTFLGLPVVRDYYCRIPVVTCRNNKNKYIYQQTLY